MAEALKSYRRMTSADRILTFIMREQINYDLFEEHCNFCGSFPLIVTVSQVCSPRHTHTFIHTYTYTLLRSNLRPLEEVMSVLRLIKNGHFYAVTL